MKGVGIVTVPVNVGFAKGAFNPKSVVKFVTPDCGNPVAFVSVPDDGVPNAPLNNTGAPALPILIPKAVCTPVPNVIVLCLPFICV